ncbi:hypothetical protein QR680_011669 [Steinernema hermaphroditum]|uniref:BTB domain-containing protein n=1 Tax=Steinernema hermaphroditum TaxID=289476 RepID=A0AA39LYG9_9BILA|nr:hypothetical protein QR680_011669 [Steinernema hermaphroditum]
MTTHKIEFAMSFNPGELQYLPNLPTAQLTGEPKQFNDLDWFVKLVYNAPEDSLSVYCINKQVDDGIPILLWGDYVYCLTYGEDMKEAKINGNILNSVSSMAFFCTAPSISAHLNSENQLKLNLQVEFARFQSYRLDIPSEDPNTVHLKLDCGKDLYVSNMILSHHSPFFANMFKYTQFKEEEPRVFNIHRVKYTTVCMILHALYGLDIYPLRCTTPEQLHETLTTCDQWLCDSAVRAMESGILKADSGSLEHLLGMADKFRMFNLVEDIARNMTQSTFKNMASVFVQLSAMTTHKIEFAMSFNPGELQYLPNLPTAQLTGEPKQFNDLDWFVKLVYNAPEDSLSVYCINKQVDDGIPILLWGDYVYCLTYGEDMKEAKINGNILNSVSSMAFFCTAPSISAHLNSENQLKLNLQVEFARFQSYRLDIPSEDPNTVHLKLDCGKDLYVSNMILSHHSPFFANMFKYTQFKEEEPRVFNIHRVKYTTVCMILHALYGLDIYPLRCTTPEQLHETLTTCDQWLCDSASTYWAWRTSSECSIWWKTLRAT